MFTGIIEELGIVKNIRNLSTVTVLEIKAGKATEDIKTGDSIAVNGICLTVVKNEGGVLTFEAIPETTKSTTIGSIKVRDKVNLERSLKIGDRLSGHFVTGHIDCVGVIRKKTHVHNNLCFEVAVPARYMKYCVPKGSISVDGISLTLTGASSNTFMTYIIPHTLKNTTLEFKGPSGKVNIEFDILAKRVG